MFFYNRKEAGEKLAAKVYEKYPELHDGASAKILALPRGGVPIGFEISKELNLPLGVIVTHKLSAPGNEEFAIGAIAEDGSFFLDPHFKEDVPKTFLDGEIEKQLAEIKRRIKVYRGDESINLSKQTVILVDDGIATGHTMKAAILLAKKAKAKKIIVAVPVLPPEILPEIKKMSEIVYLETPSPFLAIGRFYLNFEQLTDQEVINYLEAAR